MEAREVEDFRKDLKSIEINKFSTVFHKLTIFCTSAFILAYYCNKLKALEIKIKNIQSTILHLQNLDQRSLNKLYIFILITSCKRTKSPFLYRNSSSVFWKVIKKLISIIWGDLIEKNFPIFFKKL